MAKLELLSVREYAQIKNVSKETIRLNIVNGYKLDDDWNYKKVDTTWIIYRLK